MKKGEVIVMTSQRNSWPVYAVVVRDIPET